jgi:tetratricopeptide (TPR) repeat protein
MVKLLSLSFRYGVDKYVLLRVGPFADIYESLAIAHAERGDKSSALIAAEAASNKNSGFASNFLFYARLLESFDRSEEARDAARICLRLPLSSIGLTTDDFREVAILAQLADASDSDDVVMAKLQAMYEKIRAHEQDEDPRSAAPKTPEQQANDEANYLLDNVTLTGGKWSEVRPKIADIYAAADMKEMADFVNPKV